MKILEVKQLALPEIKVLRFARFRDNRGYFSETFRKSDLYTLPDLSFFESRAFVQHNESFSKKGVLRGLHFQWQPPLGKLVRVIDGHLLDMVLDIRKNSPTFGKIVVYEMFSSADMAFGEWVWLPPGFAHGLCFLKDSLIEYLCTAEYNPKAEAGISPLAEDLDWSLADSNLKGRFQEIVQAGPIMSDKDKSGFSLGAWSSDPRSDILN